MCSTMLVGLMDQQINYLYYLLYKYSDLKCTLFRSGRVHSRLREVQAKLFIATASRVERRGGGEGGERRGGRD